MCRCREAGHGRRRLLRGRGRGCGHTGGDGAISCRGAVIRSHSRLSHATGHSCSMKTHRTLVNGRRDGESEYAGASSFLITRDAHRLKRSLRFKQQLTSLTPFLFCFFFRHEKETFDRRHPNQASGRMTVSDPYRLKHPR